MTSRRLWIAVALAFVAGFGATFLLRGGRASGPGAGRPGEVSAGAHPPAGLAILDGRLPLFQLCLQLENEWARSGEKMDLAACWKKAEELPVWQRDIVQELGMRWWARKNPATALMFARSLLPGRQERSALKSVYREWALIDPGAAINGARNFNDTEREDLETMVIEIVASHAGVEDAMTLAVANGVPIESGLMGRWAEADPQKAWEHLLSKHTKKNPSLLRSVAIQVPPEQSTQRLLELDAGDYLQNPDIRKFLAAPMIERLAGKEPMKAMQLLEQHPRLAEVDGLVAGAMATWATTDASAARAWFESLEETNSMRQAAAPGMIQSGLITDRAGLDRLFESTTPAEMDNLSSAILRVPQESIEARLAWIDSWRSDVFEVQYRNAVLEVLSDHNMSNADSQAFARILDITETRGFPGVTEKRLEEFARRFPSKAAAWLMSRYRDNPPPQPLGTVMTIWAKQESAQLADWILKAPGPEIREAAWNAAREYLHPKLRDSLDRQLHAKTSVTPTTPKTPDTPAPANP